MVWILSVMLAVIAGLATGLAQAAEPLVDVAWLKSNLGRPGIVILDLRPSRGQYANGHIPGAVFSDYGRDGWRERNAAGIEGMLPPPEKLEKLIGGLGIDNQTHVILAPEGRNAADMGTATRVYWTFKVSGHDEVSILNGGFFAWIADVDKDRKPINPIDAGDVRLTAKSFKATIRREMIVERADVQKAIAEKTVLVDNRPPDFYLGLTQSFAAKRAGTLPGAQSMPEAWLTLNNGGLFRSKTQLANLYKAANVPTTGDQISFCNTGHWASLGWFVSSEILGNKQAKMFSGSMAEWSADPNLPVEVKVKAD